jgi:hypothetical protein
VDSGIYRLLGVGTLIGMPCGSDLGGELLGAGTLIGIADGSDLGGLLVLSEFGTDLGCVSAVAERLRRWLREGVCSPLDTIRLRFRRRGVEVSSLLDSIRLLLRRGVEVSASTRARLLLRAGGSDSGEVLRGRVVGVSVGAGMGVVVGISLGRFGFGLIGFGSRPFPPIGTGITTGGTIVPPVDGVVAPGGGVETGNGVVLAAGGAIDTCVTLSL